MTSLASRSRGSSHRERAPQVSSAFRSVPVNQEYCPKHHLVPLMSECRIQPHPRQPPTPDSGRPTHSGVFEPTFFTAPCVSADSGLGSMGDITDELESSPGSSRYHDNELVSVSFEPELYSESISICVTSKEPQISYVSFYEVKTKPRCKEGVELGHGLKPVSYQNKLIVYRDSTRRKFKNVVNYQSRPRAVKFAETCYVRSPHYERTYVSCIDVGGRKNERKWFESTLHLMPVTHSVTQVANVELALNSDGEEIEYDESVFTEHVRMRMDALGSAGMIDRLSSRSSFSRFNSKEPHMYSSSVFAPGRDDNQNVEAPQQLLINGSSDSYA